MKDLYTYIPVQQDTLHHAAPQNVETPAAAPVASGEADGEEAVATTADEEAEAVEVRPVPRSLRPTPPKPTPEQVDSATQAMFHVDQPPLPVSQDTTFQIPYPYTSHIDQKDVAEIFELYFPKDSLFNNELTGIRAGVAGDPRPYSIRTDDILTGILLACLMVAALALSRTRFFFFQQARNFFRIQRTDNVFEMTGTTGENRVQLFLCLQTCLLCALLSFVYTHNNIATHFSLDSPYELILIFMGSFVAYFLIKALLYSVVNNVFFDARRNMQWLRSFVFLTAIEGLLLFPLVMLQSYFNFSTNGALIYLIIVLTIVKFLTFYKCWAIFFRQNVVSLQIFLYFCTLEIVPLLSMVGVLALIVDHLKINF